MSISISCNGFNQIELSCALLNWHHNQNHRRKSYREKTRASESRTWGGNTIAWWTPQIWIWWTLSTSSERTWFLGRNSSEDLSSWELRRFDIVVYHQIIEYKVYEPGSYHSPDLVSANWQVYEELMAEQYVVSHIKFTSVWQVEDRRSTKATCGLLRKYSQLPAVSSNLSTTGELFMLSSSPIHGEWPTGTFRSMTSSYLEDNGIFNTLSAQMCIC